MRLTLLIIPLFLMCFHPADVRANDREAVKAMFGEYAAAFNTKDTEKVASFWAEDSTYLDRETGERTNGRDAIVGDIAEAFAARPNARLVGRIASVRIIKSDVASTTGQVSVGSPDEEPVTVDFSAILVLENGKWLFDSVEESPVPVPGSPYQALQRLEWLVGSWADESGSDLVENTFRWSDNGSFLIRSFASQSAEGDISRGTQVIGWDPRSLEIRSWTFNSDGSFGDATWSSSGDDWLIKSSQTLADGNAASGTYILTKISDDEITLRLIGHEVEGDPQSSGPASSLVRRPETLDGSNDVLPTTGQPAGSDQ